MHASGAWWGSDYNIGAALTMDVYLWLIRIMDAKLTGDHNSAVWRMRNPKANQTIPPQYNTAAGESYANPFASGRLARLLQIRQKTKAEIKSNQKDAEESLNDLFMLGRRMRGEA